MSVPENATIGTTVLTVAASDLDLDENGNVTYLLEMTSSDVVYFAIDKLTGVVSIARYVPLRLSVCVSTLRLRAVGYV